MSASLGAVDLDPNDIVIDIWRSNGTAMLTHRPTGRSVEFGYDGDPAAVDAARKRLADLLAD